MKKNISAVARAGYAAEVWDSTYKLIPYYDSKKKFVDAVLFWFRYLDDREGTDAELRGAMKDAEGLGMDLMNDDYSYDFDNIDLYFKKIRLELTVGGRSHVSRKFRRILKTYGYERRSAKFKEYMDMCLRCYGIDVFVEGLYWKNYDWADLDDYITFRLKKNNSNDTKRVTHRKADSLYLPDDPNVIITQFNSPNSEAELKFFYSRKKKKTDLDLILGNEREIIWSVDRITKPGDIVLFLCHKNAVQRMTGIYQHVYDRSLRSYAHKEKELYEENAGKLLGMGVAADKPEQEGDEYMALVKDFVLFDNPVPEEEFEDFITINIFGPITRISEHNWLRLKEIIKEKNPAVRV